LLGEISARVKSETATVVIGRERETELLLECFFARGHVLLEGVPGTSKTLLARAFSRCLGLSFRRVQFTPDMLPLDIVGGFIYNVKEKEFEFRHGPIFTDVMLADEINRAPPKVQSALLEAMQELQVTVEGHTEKLSPEFIVIATQNPLDFEGVYPLPEGQLDRFMMKIVFDYQPISVESNVIRRNLSDLDADEIQRVVDPRELAENFATVESVVVGDEILDYLARIAHETRTDDRIELGASPRAMVQLIHCARAKAALEGRKYVIPDDVKERASLVLSHRIRPSRTSQLKGTDTDPARIVSDIFDKVKPPR
jgi:MoxR-like ATPase